MYKAVIFDFNGTLFFDNDKHIKAWNEMSLRLRNQPITDEELHNKLNGVPNHKIIEYFLGKKIDEKLSKEYSLMKEELYRQACLNDLPSFCLVEGSVNYFKKLKEENIPFTIASASIKENIDFFVEHFHLEQWMDKETIIYDNGTYQDKELMFKDAAKNLNCKIEETLVFEDSLAGIKHAYNAGCQQIIVVCEKEKQEMFESLPGVIQTISDFTELVIDKKLKKYIDEIILPTYKNYDKAHNLNHVSRVIRNSLDIASHYDVDLNTVYVIAAFHDLGMPFGRQNHHLSSAILAYYDHVLNDYFKTEELIMIKEAIEDHRASSKNDPRSLYGKIIAEADRDIDPYTIVYRTHQFTLEHYPNLEKVERFKRSYDHLEEKYSEAGYLKLYLEESKNKEGLMELRSWIKDTDKIEKLINDIENKIKNNE